jgi:hypothetical protein
MKDHLELLKKAERRMNDEMKRKTEDCAAPDDWPLVMRLRLVVAALFCGLEDKDWDDVAEGAVMLARITNFFPWKENLPEHHRRGDHLQ